MADPMMGENSLVKNPWFDQDCLCQVCNLGRLVLGLLEQKQCDGHLLFLHEVQHFFIIPLLKDGGILYCRICLCIDM